LSGSHAEANVVIEALVVMVHGSPRPIANQDMFSVVDAVRDRHIYPIVEVGFMEINAPTIPVAIERCIARGAERIIAVPYFLHAGNHVTEDLPALVDAAQARYPQVEFRMGDFLGHDEGMISIVRDRVSEARPD
jgi:sirohydrochlorin ferrochelatase